VRVARKEAADTRENRRTAVKWGRMFIGKHIEPNRPTNQVDEQLMHRISEAKQRLIERNIEPVALLRLKTRSEAAHRHW
jgi:uncharacterized protein YktB (UPF0637 family)